ncbi:MAG: hypothetical protein PHU49_08040 [Syntrophorhabdaceae bacterium]|nr:hypothetical protein [Syntrophorhabdaceae bacterium]MDD5243953.1 hypothetical protein [Syntrophorhabdaceae bacterium]
MKDNKIIGAVIPIILFLFSVHNFFNYRENVKDQVELENNGIKYQSLSSYDKFKIIDMEIYSLILSTLLNLAGYFFIIFADCLRLSV